MFYLFMEDICKYDLQCVGVLKCIREICSFKDNDLAYKKKCFHFFFLDIILSGLKEKIEKIIIINVEACLNII